MNRGRAMVGLVAFMTLSSCQPDNAITSPSTSSAVRLYPGIERTARLALDQVAVGQTVYVPIYSSIATADTGRPINLAVTLTVRNLDQHRPIVVQAIRYHDSGGKLVRESLDSSIRVGPLASLDLFLRESDNSGGTSPSFLVEWAAETEVAHPMVEAVMISTAGSLGLTFNTVGRVISSRP